MDESAAVGGSGSGDGPQSGDGSASTRSLSGGDSASTRPPSGVHPAARTTHSQDQGGFRTHFNFPGHAVEGHADHGYGPLSTVVESYMDPGTLIGMHPHRNEEIISWVPAGVMRHDDREGNRLVTDSEHLMVMNAGGGFWHAEATASDDPPLRMLQIFVRPHSLGLEPAIQHEPLADPRPNEWRPLFGPEDGEGPLFVRNAVACFDGRIDAGTTVSLPGRADWDHYLYVFEGSVTLRGNVDSEVASGGDVDADTDTTADTDATADADTDTAGADTDAAGADSVDLGYTESAVVTADADVSVTAKEPSILVAFSIDPDAPVTRQGTIGR